jgi:methanesulfonate monooxygenase small subunit
MSGQPPNPEDVRQLIGRACLALDDGDYPGFLTLCAPAFWYRIRVWSPDLGTEMVWLEHDLDGLAKLFASLPEHLTRPGRLTRHATVYTQEPQPDALHVTSVFAIYHTDLEGRTQALAVGRYLDRIVEHDGGLCLLARDVQLETRDLGIGSHAPL